MNFGEIPAAEAAGAILAHSVRAGERRYQKGHVLTADDAAGLAAAGVERIDRLGFFRSMQSSLAGFPVDISRTGYTGDLGYEIFVDAGSAERLWDAVMSAGEDFGLRPAGNLALEMVRIEAGLLLIDVDFISSKKTLFEVQRETRGDAADVVVHALAHLEETADRRVGLGHTNSRDELVGPERGLAVTEKEVRDRDRALTTHRSRDDLRVEREEHRR